MECDRPPCNEPCKEKLPCGHSCVGLCGEQCPPLCRVCDYPELTEFCLSGNEEDDDARYAIFLLKLLSDLIISSAFRRFVYLPNCGHCIEVEGLDYWMGMDDEKNEIQMKCCPRCKTIIYDCSRYGNIIKRNMRDIVQVKKKIMEQGGNGREFAEEFLIKTQNSLSQNDKLRVKMSQSIFDLVQNSLKAIESDLTRRTIGKRLVFRPIDIYRRYTIQVKLDVVERLLKMIEKISKETPRNFGHSLGMKHQFFQDILSRSQRVLESIYQREIITEEAYNDFQEEIERLGLICSFYLLFQNTRSVYGIPDIEQVKEKVEKLLFHTVNKLNIATKTEIKSDLKRIGERLDTGLGIDDEERQQIVKAMGLKQGHWFKCPNGHIYAIGECGGAMERSVCNECQAPIGGAGHRLLGTNSLAGEMDGARHGAWSEQANMNNYVFR